MLNGKHATFTSSDEIKLERKVVDIPFINIDSLLNIYSSFQLDYWCKVTCYEPITNWNLGAFSFHSLETTNAVTIQENQEDKGLVQTSR